MAAKAIRSLSKILLWTLIVSVPVFILGLLLLMGLANLRYEDMLLQDYNGYKGIYPGMSVRALSQHRSGKMYACQKDGVTLYINLNDDNLAHPRFEIYEIKDAAISSITIAANNWDVIEQFGGSYDETLDSIESRYGKATKVISEEKQTIIYYDSIRVAFRGAASSKDHKLFSIRMISETASIKPHADEASCLKEALEL